MPLIHYLYVGHFVPHEGFIRLQEGRPVCEKPLDSLAVSELLRRHIGKEIDIDNIPSKCGMAITPDYIVCNRYGSKQVLELIAEYAKQKDAYIVDLGSLMLLNPEDLVLPHS
jgi:hypothetical protein